MEEELAKVEARTKDLVEPGGFELERVAREEYLMHGEGEQVIHLVPSDAAQEGVPAPPTP